MFMFLWFPKGNKLFGLICIFGIASAAVVVAVVIARLPLLVTAVDYGTCQCRRPSENRQLINWIHLE